MNKILKTLSNVKFIFFWVLMLFLATEIYAIDYPYQKFFPKNSKERALAQQLTDKLDQLYDNNDDNKIFSEILSIKDHFSLLIASEWLQLKSFSGDARYNYYYASSLLRMAFAPNTPEENQKTFKETATTMFFLGKLMILIDGERCKDKHIAYPTIFYELEDGIKGEISNYWKSLSDKEQNTIIHYALKIEEGLKDRKPEAWICQRSAESMTRYFETDPNCDNCTEQETEMGKTIIVPTDKITPQYIDDTEWHKKRIEIRDSFTSTDK